MSAQQLELGEYLRDRGINQVIGNNQDYKSRFHFTASEILDATGEVDSASVVGQIGMPKGHANAVGASMRSFACRNKLIVDRYRKSNRPSRHAAIIAVWKKLEN